MSWQNLNVWSFKSPLQEFWISQPRLHSLIFSLKTASVVSCVVVKIIEHREWQGKNSNRIVLLLDQQHHQLSCKSHYRKAIKRMVIMNRKMLLFFLHLNERNNFVSYDADPVLGLTPIVWFFLFVIFSLQMVCTFLFYSLYWSLLNYVWFCIRCMTRKMR